MQLFRFTVDWSKQVVKTRALFGDLWYIRAMDIEPDLTTASRETLLAIIAEQEAVIDQSQRRIGELESRPKF